MLEQELGTTPAQSLKVGMASLEGAAGQTAATPVETGRTPSIFEANTKRSIQPQLKHKASHASSRQQEGCQRAVPACCTGGTASKGFPPLPVERSTAEPWTSDGS
jgi:hypothetical protein